MVMSIVNGGALLDYRTKDGVTAMHRAVQANNFEAVKTLLGTSSGTRFFVFAFVCLIYAGRYKMKMECILRSRCVDWMYEWREAAMMQPAHPSLTFIADLGASPNYRDSRGLTPLYYSVTHNTDPLLCEALLHDYAVIGACDNQGWQETHQVKALRTGARASVMRFGVGRLSEL